MTSLQKTNPGKRPGQRRGDEPSNSAKNIGAKKWEHKESKPTSAPYSHKKEPPPEGMPLITMQSGIFIEDIKASIISYCQRMDLSRIVKILSTGEFEKKVMIQVDDTKLGDKEDPHGLYREFVRDEVRQAAQDSRDYEKSKDKLVGILRSMTSKELDEKINQLFNTQSAERDITLAAENKAAATATSTAALHLANPCIDATCPLQLWRNLVFLITAKPTGSKRLDCDNAAHNFATLRQRGNESVQGFAQRLRAAIDTYILLGMDAPSDEIQATRFVQGLDSSRYSTMQTHFMNELNNGRDIYPTDLASAVSKANRWLIPSSRGPQDVAQHAAFSALKTKAEERKVKKTPNQKPLAVTKGGTAEKLDKLIKCAYCGKPGHNILVCFKLIADQAAAKSDGLQGKKIAAATTQRAVDDADEETGFMCYPSITRNIILPYKLETNLPKNLSITTSNTTFSTYSTNLRAYAGGRHSTLLPTDVILDTGANCSIVHNRNLLTNLTSCNPVIFDGLSGSINITQKGSLGSICEAYYHKDIIANILSVSALKNEGHKLAYENESDSFYLHYSCGQCIFTRRDNGLYVCNFGPSNVFVSTVSDLESKYTKREVQEAQAARDLQRRLAAPPDTKLMKALSDGTIQGTTVTAEHVRRATSIYGPTLESIKGRTTRKKGIPIPVTDHHRVTDTQTMYIDVFFACTLPFLITKVQPLAHIMTSLLSERSATAIRKAYDTSGAAIGAQMGYL